MDLASESYFDDSWLVGKKLKCVHLFQNFGIINGKAFIHTSFRELLNDQPNLSNHLTEGGITPRNYSESLVANAASKTQIPVGRLGLWETANLSQFEDFRSTELWEEKVQKRGSSVYRLSLERNGVYRLSLAPHFTGEWDSHCALGAWGDIGLSKSGKRLWVHLWKKHHSKESFIAFWLCFYLWVKKNFFCCS